MSVLLEMRFVVPEIGYDISSELFAKSGPPEEQSLQYDLLMNLHPDHDSTDFTAVTRTKRFTVIKSILHRKFQF
jgi:hypothetical protein